MPAPAASGGKESGERDLFLTGNLRVDLFGQMGHFMNLGQEGDPSGLPVAQKKSPFLAGGLSLLVPGAGEFYAESYWKAAAFFAVEATLWTVAYINDQKGDDQTVLFEGYADENWSVRQYAEWTLSHATMINSSVDLDDHQDVLVGDMGVNWNELNALERDIGNWYSHTLPPYGDQQYYELIGKYQQYYQGWADADATLDTYEEVSAKLNAGGTQFTYYSSERGKANDYYGTASTAVTIVVVNHIVSALDAAWSASSYNSRIEAGIGFQKAKNGPSYTSFPAFQVSYRF
jgi:hypothetical protein